MNSNSTKRRLMSLLLTEDHFLYNLLLDRYSLIITHFEFFKVFVLVWDDQESATGNLWWINFVKFPNRKFPNFILTNLWKFISPFKGTQILKLIHWHRLCNTLFLVFFLFFLFNKHWAFLTGNCFMKSFKKMKEPHSNLIVTVDNLWYN